MVILILEQCKREMLHDSSTVESRNARELRAKMRILDRRFLRNGYKSHASIADLADPPSGKINELEAML